MSTQIGSVSTTSAVSSKSSTNASTTAQALTDTTKQQLQALGVDTSNITTEAQGQIALLQAQQQQQTQESKHNQSGSDKAEMEALKSQAIKLASKLGINVSSNEKLDDIIAAIGPAIQAKSVAAGNDQVKLAEIQELQTEYNSLSSELSNIQAQHSQQAQSSQGTQTLASSLSNMAAQNKLYHQV